MKKGVSVKGGSKTMVMVGLLAVLLISLGYLSMQSVKEGLGNKQGRQGFTDKAKKMTAPPNASPPAMAAPSTAAPPSMPSA